MWLRHFTLDQINDFYERQNKENSSSSSGNSKSYNIDLANPDKSLLAKNNVVQPPSYVTNMSKK